jgi:hypothetical protein
MGVQMNGKEYHAMSKRIADSLATAQEATGASNKSSDIYAERAGLF